MNHGAANSSSEDQHLETKVKQFMVDQPIPTNLCFLGRGEPFWNRLPLDLTESHPLPTDRPFHQASLAD